MSLRLGAAAIQAEAPHTCNLLSARHVLLPKRGVFLRLYEGESGPGAPVAAPFLLFAVRHLTCTRQLDVAMSNILT
jgi:hypothetical protein